MACSKTMRRIKLSNKESEEDEEEAFEEPWQWWSKFHERLEWDKRIGVVLEITADLPSQDIVKRWLGEPVKAIVVPTSIFHTNKKGYDTTIAIIFLYHHTYLCHFKYHHDK